jgi:hypothetical protein
LRSLTKLLVKIIRFNLNKQAESENSAKEKFMARYEVTATSLNLRSAPRVVPANRIAVLPQGHEVTKLDEANNPLWWRVSTNIEGVAVEGFVNSQYLTEVGSAPSVPTFNTLEAVHLTNTQRTTRVGTGRRAFPLNEPRQPGRTGTTPGSKATSLARIIDWLNVEQSARYIPGGGNTFCNIYAYDYCYLAGAYLPRVWWNSIAIQRLGAGIAVTPRYGETVRELNANSLYEWLSNYGQNFGWRREFDLTRLQDAANDGEVCLINAQRRELNRSGHIVAVVPETAQHQARRNSASVLSPIQSQAGAQNFRYGGTNRTWWTGSQFRAFGFWIHS